MELPLISIITPFRDSARYIDECIQSILAQTYQNWELIAIDDHSSDESHKIVEAYSDEDDRIIVHKNQGHGIINALNQAFTISSGSFITRMDSDDIMTENKLEEMSKQLSQSGQGYLALGLVKYFSKGGISAGYKDYEDWLNGLIKGGRSFQEIYKECSIPSPCWMAHRSDLVLAGAFQGQLYPEDYDLAFRFYRLGLKPLASDKLLHLWRDHPSRTSKTSSRYNQEHFTKLKVHYFIKVDYDHTKLLCVLGTGEKGKTIASYLIEQRIEFKWVTNHPSKIGQNNLGQRIIDWDDYIDLNSIQSIVSFRDLNQQRKIRKTFTDRGMHENVDFFMFC